MVFRLFTGMCCLALLLSSCEGKDEPVPAYLRIDSLSLNIKIGEGNEVHQIKAVQVYSPTRLLGLFELPATIPVLETGDVKFSIVPAVYLNGSSSQMVTHTGFLPLDTTLTMTRGTITHFSNPRLNFRNSCNFLWTEDFEDNSSTVVGVNVVKGDTTLITSESFDLEGRFPSVSKVYTALIAQSDTNKYIDLGSFKTFNTLPSDGRDIFLEFSIKSDIPVQLALKRTKITGSEYVPYLYLFETGGQWKHFYVNLVYEAGGQPSGTEYQILFSSDVTGGSGAHKIHIDNIRLTYNN